MTGVFAAFSSALVELICSEILKCTIIFLTLLVKLGLISGKWDEDYGWYEKYVIWVGFSVILVLMGAAAGYFLNA